MTEPEPASWTDLVGEPVHTSDDERLGDIEAINHDFVVVKRGLVSPRRFYVPLSRVEGWDGRSVWLKVTEEEAKQRYRKDKRPDPYDFFFSSATPTDASRFTRNFQINMPKIDRTYQEDKPFVTSSPQPAEEPRLFACELCGEKFRSASDLGEHVAGH